MTHSVCHTFIRSSLLRSWISLSIWPLPLVSIVLLKRLALETFDVSWNVVAQLIIKEHCSLNLLALAFNKNICCLHILTREYLFITPLKLELRVCLLVFKILPSILSVLC